jgi:transposase-like protein
MKSCDSIAELAGELGVHRSVLYDWRDQLAPLYRTEWQKAEEAGESPLARENRLLKQALGEKTLEVDFFKGALQKVGARSQGNSKPGETASTTKSGS